MDADVAAYGDTPRVRARDAAAPRSAQRRDALLMCAPDYFGVDYIINPWMENQIGRATPSRAR